MARTLQNTNFTANTHAQSIFGALQKGVADIVFNSAGLAIGTSSKKAIKVANTIYGIAAGVLFSKASAEAAVAGTVTNAKYNVFVVTVKADGTLTTRMGTEGAALINVVFPTIPADELVVGFVIVHPTGTGNFVGATTDFDDATVVPNAVYVNCTSTFNPVANAL